MKEKIITLIFHAMEPAQIERILKDMERLAREKHFAVIQYYSESPEKDATFDDEFQEMIQASPWESYLPEEYHIIKRLQYEDRAKQAS